MYHSITIGDKNTWDDWHLIPVSQPVVAPPSVVTKFVEIPGMDGSVDLTEALTGYPTYTRRTGSWQFIVAPGYGQMHTRYSEILDYLHGNEFTVSLEDEPSFFYEGRLSVTAWEPGKSWSAIEINYELMPYKREYTTSVDDWLWDPFNFELDVIRDWSGLRVDGELTITIIGSEGRIVPDIAVSAPMSITYNGKTFEAPSAGTYHAVDLTIVEGEHDMTFSGNGIVTVYYRGGRL